MQTTNLAASGNSESKLSIKKTDGVFFFLVSQYFLFQHETYLCYSIHSKFTTIIKNQLTFTIAQDIKHLICAVNYTAVIYVNRLWPIAQFRYIKIQPKTMVLRTRLRDQFIEFVGFIPRSLVLRSIVLG